MDEAVATIKKVVSAMRFKCIEDTGYEGRLTAGKVYKNLPTPFPDEGFIVVRFDDDTQGEVYKERFEFVNFRAMAEEGVRCDCGSGTWVYPDTVEGCTCHLGHPPCGQCTSQQLYCDYCGVQEEDVEHVPKPTPKSIEQRAAAQLAIENLDKFKAMQNESWSRR